VVVCQDNQLRILKKKESAVRKSRNVSKKQVLLDLAVKRRSKVLTLKTNYLKVIFSL
jgi:hypothetical protein